MSEGGEARNHEAEVEAVARALAVIRDRAKYLSEPAWTLEGCAIVGRQIYKLACEAEAALDAVRRSPQDEDHEVERLREQLAATQEGRGHEWLQGRVRELEAELAARSPQGEDHEAGDAEDRERKVQENLTHEDGIEAAAEALCAWPSVKVDDREHNTATHMATDAVAAYLSHVSAPFAQGEDHEAMVQAVMGALVSRGWVLTANNQRDLRAAFSLATSPVSGTEPDTAKLVAEYVRKNFGLVTADCTAGTIADFILAGFSVDAGKPAERVQHTRLIAGIQWVRGMCSDEEPYEVIDAKLAELLDGGTEGLRVQAPGETPQPEDDVIVRWECPVCGWSIADESGVEGQPCEAWMQDDEDGEHGECRPVRYVRESALAPEHDAEKLVIARKALDECHEEIMRLEAERDAYRAALEEIRDSDSVDAALDPDRARRVARSVLAGESSTTEE